MRKWSTKRFLDRRALGTAATVAVVTAVGLATQMTSDSDQVPPEVEQKASDADQSTPDADQPEYMAKTKPTRMWPNALEAKEGPSTAES
jgi:hypothetical protein